MTSAVQSRDRIDGLEDMAWAVPEYSRNQVDKAGFTLVDPNADVVDEWRALGVINNWRASHAYPLNNVQMNLRAKVKRVQAKVIVAQRTKRLESIAAKLTRGQTKTLQLSQMQDIAGCRAVLSNVVNLSKVVAAYRRSHFSHILKSEKDYIANPKEDGYRGYHLVYQYQGLPGQINSYDKMRIEIQLRTELQHVWATAVEAVGTFTKQALKSNQGSKEWLRLFMLMSSYIALKEKCPTIKETPSDLEGLCAEIREISASIHAQQLLGAYKVTVQMAGKMSKSAKYFLVNYKFSDHVVSVTDFGATQSQAANDAYTKTEAGKNEGDNIVLVSVDSIKNLKRAYPNYFLDTTQFASLLTEAISYRARPAGKSRSS